MSLDTDVHGKTLKVAGEEICYYEAGQGSTVVLIHGMFGDFLDWEPVLGPLARAHHVIALDLPGFGRSSKPDRDYTGDFFVSILRQFLVALNVGEAAVIGNSFGGQMAVLYAVTHPESVAKLVLVDSGGFQRYTPDEIALTETRFGEPVIAGLTPEINSLLFAPVFAQSSTMSAQHIDRQNAKLKRSDYAAYARAIARNIHLSLVTYLLDRLPEVKCPTLLVWGEKDSVLPIAQAEAALARLANGTLVILPNCGHMPQLDDAGAFVGAVERFLGPA